MHNPEDVQAMLDYYEKVGQLWLVGIDPGETTGFVLVDLSGPTVRLAIHGQYGSKKEQAALESTLYRRPDVAIVEDYIIYPHMVRQHVGSRVPTLRELGRIEWLCHKYELPLTYQLASQAKNQWPVARVRKHFPAQEVKPTSVRRGEFLNHHTLAAFQHVLTFLENQKLREFFAVEHAI